MTFSSQCLLEETRGRGDDLAEQAEALDELLGNNGTPYPFSTERFQINFSPFKLACPSLPAMMWPCTEIPNGFATSTMMRVISMSARAGSDCLRDDCAPTDCARYRIDSSRCFQSSGRTGGRGLGAVGVSDFASSRCVTLRLGQCRLIHKQKRQCVHWSDSRSMRHA